MPVTLDAALTAPTPTPPPSGSWHVPTRFQGWSGIAFAVSLLVFEAAMTLPATSHTTSYLRDFYRHHRSAIVVTQLGQLLAAWFFWHFTNGLAAAVAGSRSAAHVRAAGRLVCAGSLLTAAPVLALALGLGSAADATTRVLAAWTDHSDVILSVLIAVFGAVCARTSFPTWVRVVATGLAGVFVAHAALAWTGRLTLNAVAPTLFLAFVVALSVRNLLLRRRGRPSHETVGQRQDRPRSLAVRHPVAALLLVGIGVTWLAQLASLLAGVDVTPAKIAELVVLLALATAITVRVGGAGAARRLYAGLTRWRLGWWWPVVLATAPLLTVAVGLATGTLHAPTDGWTPVLGTYALFLVLGALSGNVWEETVWGGFVQGRLMAARGLLIGSLLTSIPFFLIHLPLAFEADGWKGTSGHDALVDWGLILLSVPFQRYLIGTLLVDTGGSTLGAGLLHASINAAGAMAVVPGGWQHIPALIVLTLVVAAVRSRRGLSATEGGVPSLLPAAAAAAEPATCSGRGRPGSPDPLRS